ncbi:MAG: hypothetical protein ACRCUX_01775, partial [Beijerinckiaceae bacterium]
MLNDNLGRKSLLDDDSPAEPGTVDVEAERKLLAALPPPPASAGPLTFQPPVDLPPEQIKVAQTELKRLGCYTGPVSGQTNRDFFVALDVGQRSQRGDVKPLSPLTREGIDFLRERKDRLCTGTVQCGPGQSKQGTTCIAARTPTPPAGGRARAR